MVAELKRSPADQRDVQIRVMREALECVQACHSCESCSDLAETVMSPRIIELQPTDGEQK